MRYNSPVTQFVLAVITLTLTLALQRIVGPYLIAGAHGHSKLPTTLYLSSKIILCITGIIGIFLVNLIKIRYIFLLYALTSTVYAGSTFALYKGAGTQFNDVVSVFNDVAFNIARVGALVFVLAYTREKWKARSIAVFLMIQYLSMGIGNLIKMLGHSDTGRHINVAIVYVSITCLSPFFALAILSTDKVVRDDGVYIISPKTTLWIEAKELVKIFTNKYMLLFIPYMFSYRFLEGFDIDYTEDLSMMVAHDFGKLFMILMGQLLDVQWATRRTRGLASLLLLTSILIIHYSLSTYLRLNSYDLSKLSSSMSLEEINAFYSQESNRRVHRILVCSYFFGGVSSGFTRLFGFWVMGTFTNDFKSSARFIGTYQCIKTFAVFMGTELSTHIATKKRYADILYLAALSMFAVALVLAYFVVRHITETNDWSFANISSYGNSNDIMLEDLASKAQVVDVKYQHVGRS